MFSFFKKKQTLAFHAPTNGTVIALAQVPDPVFSEGMMGPGLAIELASDEIYAPIEGRVTSVFPTKHAISLETKDKKAILLHMGLDTVELNGAGFEIFVKENDLVTPNTRLAKIDRAFLKAQGKDDLLVILFPEEKTIPDYPLGQTEKQAPLFYL